MVTTYKPDREDVAVEWAGAALYFGRRAHAGHGALWGSMPRNGGRLDPHLAVLAARRARHGPAGVTMPMVGRPPFAATTARALRQSPAFFVIGRNFVDCGEHEHG